MGSQWHSLAGCPCLLGHVGAAICPRCVIIDAQAPSLQLKSRSVAKTISDFQPLHLHMGTWSRFNSASHQLPRIFFDSTEQPEHARKDGRAVEEVESPRSMYYRGRKKPVSPGQWTLGLPGKCRLPDPVCAPDLQARDHRQSH